MIVWIKRLFRLSCELIPRRFLRLSCEWSEGCLDYHVDETKVVCYLIPPTIPNALPPPPQNPLKDVVMNLRLGGGGVQDRKQFAHKIAKDLFQARVFGCKIVVECFCPSI